MHSGKSVEIVGVTRTRPDQTRPDQSPDKKLPTGVGCNSCREFLFASTFIDDFEREEEEEVAKENLLLFTVKEREISTTANKSQQTSYS